MLIVFGDGSLHFLLLFRSSNIIEHAGSIINSRKTIAQAIKLAGNDPLILGSTTILQWVHGLQTCIQKAF